MVLLSILPGTIKRTIHAHGKDHVERNVCMERSICPRLRPPLKHVERLHWQDTGVLRGVNAIRHYL